MDWYVRECLPAMASVDGVFRARLFEVDEEISNIKTAERAIYGGGPGRQKFLLYCEMMTPEIADSPVFCAVGRGEIEPKMLKNVQNIYGELSWLEFAIYNPDYM